MASLWVMMGYPKNLVSVVTVEYEHGVPHAETVQCCESTLVRLLAQEPPVLPPHNTGLSQGRTLRQTVIVKEFPRPRYLDNRLCVS